MSKEFKYSYSAPTEKERLEVERIKKQYEVNQKDEKLQVLRKLNSKVKNIPSCVSLILGIIGTLIFGLGLTLALVWNSLWAGIVVGIVGCVPISFAYPAYNKLYTKLKNKYGEEIISLSNEILNQTYKETDK